MASLAYQGELTLAPFRRIYGDVEEAALLADSFYTNSLKKVDQSPSENINALTPCVIQMPDRARFETAVESWLEDTEFDSLPDEMKDHESFRSIVSDGMAVVPLIAAHLRRTPSFLFLAFEDIFAEDPIPEEAYGNLRTTISAWLRWLQR